ncbi:unnamed protein product [Linum trigynum]|uniref:Uncharacterized protein n=1 Tax=Linum trigynum TaxID=586398 RepID=A0AAV2EGX1_9ROSI
MAGSKLFTAFAVVFLLLATVAVEEAVASPPRREAAIGNPGGAIRCDPRCLRAHPKDPAECCSVPVGDNGR